MTNEQIQETQSIIEEKSPKLNKTKQEMSKVIVGQKKLLDRLLIALLCKGHILLEGVPGLAKTTAISTLAKVLNLDFQRIQFTPDLLPSDLIGSRIFNQKDNSFYIQQGPIFKNFILADEINRSPAKVQSALLEAMQERQTTIAEQTFSLPDPFLVMATQNPIEQEGTYPLPEAQVDRFLIKTIVEYPSEEEELSIMNKAEIQDSPNIDAILSTEDIKQLQTLTHAVFIDPSLKEYIKNIVFATRSPKEKSIPELEELIAFGASPRASIGLMIAAKANALLSNRGHVIPEDIKEIAPDILRHRIIPTYEAIAEGVNSDDIIKTLLSNVQVP